MQTPSFSELNYALCSRQCKMLCKGSYSEYILLSHYSFNMSLISASFFSGSLPFENHAVKEKMQIVNDY